ncbi:MAG: 30S ribosomal protein S7 [Nitrospiraceae bacterium]|nr:30S ribosomal protein S7 [Nitrospiraceae bacterium]
MESFKLYNQWDVSGIEVEDMGLKKYISLRPVLIARSEARYTHSRFHKSKIPIVERLVNKVMITGHKGKKHFISSGHNTGKILRANKIVRDAFEIIERKMKINPVAVFVKALEVAAPREEIVTLEYGGARYTKQVECPPQRRIDLVLRYFTQGARQKSFNSRKSMASALAEEIMNAYNGSNQSAAVNKKIELERQADASR